MDTEKQRQRRRDDARLTESGNARSEQLLVVPTESLTNREWLPRELLSGSERRSPGWFLDMKYQTCYSSAVESFVHLTSLCRTLYSVTEPCCSVLGYTRVCSMVYG